MQSRRQEIKQKEILQLKFQQAVKQNNDKVADWLQPWQDVVSAPNGKATVNLPIIDGGLNSDSINKGSAQEDFLRNGKAPNRRSANNSTIMSSLIKKVAKNNKTEKKPKTKRTPRPASSHNDEDEEDSTDAAKSATAKKPKLLF